ncbi:MAG: NFYB/HAP3 family transcription factor subunit [Candidatus Aenigmarchaeota archaeon]|nr:NFYB/HAP3 family transcription factor subunit [Candidatus Aenigmarchaeota archaeon]
MELTIAPIKKLIKKAGAKRVSDDAAIELAKIMEQKAVEICVKAGRLAKYSNRKTVMKKDIKLAAKE